MLKFALSNSNISREMRFRSCFEIQPEIKTLETGFEIQGK